jgi:hypothetical protein
MHIQFESVLEKKEMAKDLKLHIPEAGGQRDYGS